MKVGILTASRTNNNGTDLQALAMQKMLDTIGINAEIIDYICNKLERSHKIFPDASLRNIPKIPMRLYNNYAHNNFRRKYFKKSRITYSENTFSNIDYDVVIVGSDQIWNLDITGYDKNFFLPLKMSKTLKYSYAASLGKTDLQRFEDKHQISEHLKDFQGISVREESGVIALAKIEVQARHDLDPILMIDNKFWITMMDNFHRERPYILLYLVEPNAKIVKEAKIIAKKLNLEVIMISKTPKVLKGVIIKRFVSVTAWLTYMNNAKIIITNSYHGLSFAITLQKNFRLVMLSNSEQSNTRMIGLLENLGLEDFVVDKMEDIEKKEPNWRNVDIRLSDLRIKSSKYLKSILDSTSKKDNNYE